MLLAAVFDDQAKAQDGSRLLQALHSEGIVTLYAHALVERERRRRQLSVREPFHEGMVAAAPAAAALVGALISLIGGPTTSAMLTLESGLVGAVRDVIEAGLDPAFLEDVAARLRPGSFCLVAELEADEPFALDAGIACLGGRTMRQEGCAIRLEELVLRNAEALRQSHNRLLASPPDGASAVAASAMRRANVAELRQYLERARLLAAVLRRQATAKVAVLRSQAALTGGPARQMIEARAGRARTLLEERAIRLDRLIEDIGPLLARARERH
jgi:uncharacterized membrane protein